MDEAEGVSLVLGEEQHRFAFAEAGEEKAARRLFIGRLLVELAIRVKQRGDGADVGGSGLQDLDLERFGVHADKETRPGARRQLLLR